MRYAAWGLFQSQPSAELSNKDILGITIPKGKSISVVFRSAVYQPEVVDG